MLLRLWQVEHSAPGRRSERRRLLAPLLISLPLLFRSGLCWPPHGLSTRLQELGSFLCFICIYLLPIHAYPAGGCLAADFCTLMLLLEPPFALGHLPRGSLLEMRTWWPKPSKSVSAEARKCCELHQAADV